MIKTAEFVSPKHPDKLCDFIADSILDAYLKKDKKTRSGIEVMGGHKSISVSGEIRSSARVDITEMVKKIMGPLYHVHLHIVEQSPFIAKGVDKGGAGDQGIMIGFACNETKNFMPLEYELARNLCRKIYKQFPFDGKVQVTIENNKIKTVVASFQNTRTAELLELVKKIIKSEEYLINPAGEWSLGGFDADSGLSGRKLVIDSYGPQVPTGGGSFSGKDYTKVDRSGAYMARKIAVDMLKKYTAEKVLVKLAYAIGKRDPVMAIVTVDEKEFSIPKSFDLTPAGIKRFLKLDRPVFSKTSAWGHFGRGFAWD